MFASYALNFGVPISIVLALLLGFWCRSSLSRWILLLGGSFFLAGYSVIAIFGTSCDGHPFIGYAQCSVFPDWIASLAAQIGKFATVGYVIAAGPLLLIAIVLESRLRFQKGNG